MHLDGSQYATEMSHLLGMTHLVIARLCLFVLLDVLLM